LQLLITNTAGSIRKGEMLRMCLGEKVDAIEEAFHR